MTPVTPGFSTSLPSKTIDGWSTRFQQAFAESPMTCAVPKGTYPMASRALAAYVGSVAVKVDADMNATLRHHPPTAERRAPALTLAFSHPVRITKDVFPGWAQTRVARRVCGEYSVAISRVVLDGNGRVTFYAETGRLLSWPLAYGESLWKLQHRVRYGSAPVVNAAFFAEMVDALVTQLTPSAAHGTVADHGRPAAVENLSLSARVRDTDHYSVHASGDLRQVASALPLARAVAQNPLCLALLAPARAAAEGADGAQPSYRLQASAVCRSGTADLRAKALPAAPQGPAWDAKLTFEQPQQSHRRLVRGVVTASTPAAPVAALVHGFANVEVLKNQAPPPSPAPVQAAGRELPKHVEEPLLQVFAGSRLTAGVTLRAGTYHMESWAPGGRLEVAEGGALEFDVKTRPVNRAGEVRLQRAAMRWTGPTPLVWRIGFTDFILGAAVGRFLDRLFHVRIHGFSAGRDGELCVNGDLYLLGLRLCKIDTLRYWAARRWPEMYPVARAETDVAKWLQGIYMWPGVPWTNDEFWHVWRDICAMDPGIRWQLQPLTADRLRADVGPGAQLTSASLTGEVILTDAGDVTLTVAPEPGLSLAAFAYTSSAAAPVNGAWSARLTKHIFPYPEGTPATANTPDETRIEGVLDVKLTTPLHAQGQATFAWAAANPDAFSARFTGGVTLEGGHVTGALEAQGRLVDEDDDADQFVEALEEFADDAESFADAAETFGPAPFILDQATWRLDSDLVMPGLTVGAGQGGFFTQFTPWQRLCLASMRSGRLS